MEDNYTETFNVSHIPDVFTVCRAVLKRRFSASDLGVPYRWIYHWDDKGLLFIPSDQDGSWRKFNFIDFLWVEIITELRQCGLSLDNIYELKQVLGIELEMDSKLLHDWFDADSDQIRKKDKHYLNVLLLLVAECLATGSDLFLLVSGDGDCMIYNETTSNGNDTEIYHFRQKTHVSLSLRHILVQFINKYELVDELTTLSLVGEHEFEIIKLMRKGTISRLIVERDQMADLVLNKEDLEDKEQAEYLFVDGILNQSYSSVQYRTTTGKEVTFRKDYLES